MSKEKTVYTEVEVEIDISEFDTEDLIDELEDRGSLPVDGSDSAKELITAIWLKRRMGNHNYQTELDSLIYTVLGKAV